MASALEHTYEASPRTNRADIRAQLDALSEDDISVSSPISAGGRKVAIGTIDTDEWTVTVRVEGHDGDWTKTSEEALRKAVQRATGVGDLIDADGGYDPDD